MSMDYSHYRCTPKMACFTCRKSFKHRYYASKNTVCPECGGKLHNMGTHFRPPKQSDVDHWQAVEMLYAAGVRFGVYDSHVNYWIEEYKQRGAEMSRFELGQVLMDLSIRWQYSDRSSPGRRPSHPRDVPAFLEWWEEQELVRQRILLEVCEKLGVPPPPGLKGKLLLQKFANKPHPRKQDKPLTVPKKKRKRNKLRRFDPK